MKKDTDYAVATKQLNNDFYKDMLKSYILGTHLLPQVSEAEIENYIAVFSLYLQHSNDTYKYNFSYLSNQHKKYVSFLKSATKKLEKLKEIVSFIKKTDSITKIEDNFSVVNVNNITISINDFLTATLEGHIDFHKSFSISRVDCKEEKDIITIEYNQQVRIVKLSTSNELYLKKIITTIEEILNNTLRMRGEE